MHQPGVHQPQDGRHPRQRPGSEHGCRRASPVVTGSGRRCGGLPLPRDHGGHSRSGPSARSPHSDSVHRGRLGGRRGPSPAGAGGRRAWTVWETADREVSHHAGSADPGQPGNVVLSGHNNLYTEVFRRLSDVEAGDELHLRSEDGRTWVYQVTRTLIVREVGVPPAQLSENARRIQPTQQPVVTLVSCWPYWSNSQRVIVRARLVGPQDG